MNRTRTSKNAKRLLVWILTLTMVLSLLPMAAFADETVVEEPVVSEEPVQETEPSSEPTEAPSEPSEEPSPEPEESAEEDPADEPSEEDTFAAEDEIATQAVTIDGYEYSIVLVDCGRRYFSVTELSQIIDAASDAGMHYVMLAVGNDGLRFLLDDMKLTVNGVTYSHEAVTNAIKKGNDDYAVFEKNALTQSEMNTIMEYACGKGVEIIPLINTPGHMDAILSAANTLTGVTCNYSISKSTSKRTIDVTNETATAFTKALLQKYIEYFAACGCTMFSMGADEYGNDIGSTPHFSNLIESKQYTDYVDYLNAVARLIKDAGMKPMAFNDGIYYGEETSLGTIDPDIIVCYWSSGYGSYKPASAAFLNSKGFNLVNTHGDWYWVLGGVQCSTAKANEFDPTVFMGSNISSPVGAMFCIWCDEPTNVLDLSKPIESLKVFGTKLPETKARNVNHGVAGTTPDTDNGDEKEEVPVSVTVSGKPYTVTVEGNVVGTFKQCEDTSVATASVEYTKVEGKTEITRNVINVAKNDGGTSTGVISDENGHYMVVDSSGNITSTTNASDATQFSVYGYTMNSTYYCYIYCTVNGSTKYLTVKNNSLDTSNYTWFTYSNSSFASGSYRIVYNSSADGGKWTVSTSSDDTNRGRLYEVTTTTTEPVDATVLTITGKAKGETTCELNNTVYKITVNAADLTNVTPLSIEYWITNGRVTSNGLEALSVSADENTASDNGVAVSELVPKTGLKEKIRTEYYWRCRLLDKTLTNDSTSGTEEQKAEEGDDETLSGVGFTRVRYYNGTWAVYTENYEWVAVESKHQLVAYYREKVEVTDEVDSYAADFGDPATGETGSAWINPNSVDALSYQVVYEDSSTNPEDITPDLLNPKTVIYGYWTAGRGIGSIMIAETSNYEVYKVTAATGTFKGDSGDTYNYSYKIDSFTWDKVEGEDGEEKYNEITVWDENTDAKTGDEIVIQSSPRHFTDENKADNLVWTKNNQVILIRIYVRAKVTEDSLTVHYVDITDKDKPDEFYSYNIGVEKGVTFSEEFKRTAAGTLEGNTVKNISGRTQTILYKLEDMKEVGAQYKYATYEFVAAERINDGERAGKDVYLYYTFTRDKTFVVDYGIPLKITPSAINDSLGKAHITNVDVARTTYAKITPDSEYNIIYELEKTLDKKDTFSALYTGTKINDENQEVVDSVKYTIEIIPASSVYYEESFVTFESGHDTASAAKWEYDPEGITISANQQLSALGSGDIYGNDEAYNNSTKFSLGNAKKVTITSAMLNGWTANSAWPTATFTFEGTGFDVISLTSNTTAAIAVNLVGTTANGEQVSKKYMVNTYYGYTYNEDTEKWEVDTSKTDTLYQIPVIKVTGLDYGDYTVTIMPFYNVAFDMQDRLSNDFWLDAIRVYDPLGKDYKDYAKDQEGYPQYIMLRDKVADEKATTNDELLFIDGAARAEVAQYKNYGPNNEVYLANGQAISFKLPANANIDSIQIGAKAPNASDTSKPTMSVRINNTDLEPKVIGTATEMYYEISDNGDDAQQVTIANTGAAILSLTNLKITYSEKSETSLEKLSADDEEMAVATVCALFAEPEEPEKTFEPSRFGATWSKNVRAGERAVLTVKTSEDVESITVNGVPVTTYKTRTERTGWGRNAQRVTYREFTYMISDAQNADYTVIAVNADGTSSAPQIVSLNVIPARPTRPGWGWLEDLFGRWF